MNNLEIINWLYQNDSYYHGLGNNIDTDSDTNIDTDSDPNIDTDSNPNTDIEFDPNIDTDSDPNIGGASNIDCNLNQNIELFKCYKKNCILWSCEWCGGKKKQGNINQIRFYKE